MEKVNSHAYEDTNNVFNIMEMLMYKKGKKEEKSTDFHKREKCAY